MAWGEEGVAPHEDGVGVGAAYVYADSGEHGGVLLRGLGRGWGVILGRQGQPYLNPLL